jgi:hypothetical protein
MVMQLRPSKALKLLPTGDADQPFALGQVPGDLFFHGLGYVCMYVCRGACVYDDDSVTVMCVACTASIVSCYLRPQHRIACIPSARSIASHVYPTRALYTCLKKVESYRENTSSCVSLEFFGGSVRASLFQSLHCACVRTQE